MTGRAAMLLLSVLAALAAGSGAVETGQLLAGGVLVVAVLSRASSGDRRDAYRRNHAHRRHRWQ